MPDESFVQVAPDSTGKRIRNISLMVPQPDGTPVLTQMQVVSMVDRSGNLIDIDTAPLLEELLEVGKHTNELLAKALGLPGWQSVDQDDLAMASVSALWARRGLAVDIATPYSPVRAMSDVFGRQVTLPHGPRELVGTQGTTISASVTETTIVTAAPDVFNDLALLIVSNTSAATSTRIDIRDTTAGTVLFSLQSIGGGPPTGFALPVPIPQTSKNTNWTAQCATSTTDIRIYAAFVKNR